MGLRFAVVVGAMAFSLAAHAGDAPLCSSWKKAEHNLKIRNYQIKPLTEIGVARTAQLLIALNWTRQDLSALPGVKGYVAATNWLFITDGTHYAGGVPADRSMVALVDANGRCVGEIGGTIEYITSVLDGTAIKAAEAVAN